MPREVLIALFNIPYNLYGFLTVVALTGLIIFLLLRGNNVAGVLDAERNLVYSNEGTYGTAGWMTKKELHTELEVTGDLKRCRGTILGELNGKAVCVPEKTFMNRNVAVYGAAGSMKSRAYVRNMCYQLVRREESIIFTDPKGELFSDMAEYLKSHGYIVRVFNLKTPENSDPWDCLGEIEGSELFAQMFSDVIIKNTINGKGDHFWDNSEMCLLKALCLYVEYGDNYPPEKKNIGEVYKLLTVASGTELYTMFDKLPPSHPAKAPFAIFQQASDNVRGGIIIGLASRIQVFQNSMICDITKGYYNADGSKKVDENGYDIGIDLVLPGKEKCAYFCIISDQDSTFTFLSSLFLSFLFIKLVRFADSQPGQRLPRPVHLLADELANIGTIPDLTKKISTVRSRLISMSVIFQNIAQMENRYPENAWMEIIGNCDTQLFLGCTDPVTADFISARTGEVTIGVEGVRKDFATVRLTNYSPRYQASTSVGKRVLLTPDEVLRMPRDEALVIFRGQKVLKVKKFDFTKHPESKSPYMKECNASDYIPLWRYKDMGGGKIVDTFTGEVVQEETPPIMISLDKDTPSDTDTIEIMRNWMDGWSDEGEDGEEGKGRKDSSARKTSKEPIFIESPTSKRPMAKATKATARAKPVDFDSAPEEAKEIAEIPEVVESVDVVDMDIVPLDLESVQSEQVSDMPNPATEHEIPKKPKPATKPKPLPSPPVFPIVEEKDVSGGKVEADTKSTGGSGGKSKRISNPSNAIALDTNISPVQGNTGFGSDFMADGLEGLMDEL